MFTRDSEERRWRKTVPNICWTRYSYEAQKKNMLQISQVIFYLLLRQLPEPRAFRSFHAFIPEEMISWGTNDAYTAKRVSRGGSTMYHLRHGGTHPTQLFPHSSPLQLSP